MSLAAVAERTRPPPEPPGLAARAAAGDRDAFTEIYRGHVDAVYARLTRLLGPTADREDVLQQVFLQVHRSLGRFRGEASLATFIHRIAVNVAIDHLRTRHRQPVPIDDDALAALLGGAGGPDTIAHRRELTNLFALLGDLTVDKRVAFVLIAIDGLAVREAAELIGANPDTVKQRALAARREIEAALAARDRSQP